MQVRVRGEAGLGSGWWVVDACPLRPVLPCFAQQRVLGLAVALAPSDVGPVRYCWPWLDSLARIHE